ncbi:Major facilitator superfamily MFS_1 [Candidatus Sulfopaludibacter sp. SbA3]|nr:Major facilitator superfamily MFS_1 [Candidatus Sulfopaludibacter sp. SbA3]
MAAPGPQLSFKEVLSVREVRRLWIAQLVSIFGDFLAVFAVFAIVTFQLHGTPTQVAMILVSYLLPLAVISPLAGVFVDKWNVKWTMIASDVIRGFLVLTLLFERDLYVIYGTFLLLSTVSAFFLPAQAVAVRTLAPPNGLMVVNALMSQAVQGSQIISPAISGLLVQGLGANSCFLFDSLSFFFSAGMVLSLTIHREAAPASTAASSVLHSLSQGFRFIFTHTVISFVMLSMTAGMFAVRCFGALLSVYVRDVLLSNAALFGTLNSLIGIGMIVGSQCVHRFAQKISHQHLVIYGLGGMGVGVLFTALFGTVATTAVGMLALGFFAAFIMITAQTLIQKETPGPMLGRVSSSLMSLMAISQVLAMFVAGPVAQKAGIQNLYYGSAAMLVTIGVFGYSRLRR